MMGGREHRDWQRPQAFHEFAAAFQRIASRIRLLRRGADPMIQTRLGYFMGYPDLAVPIPETSCAYPGGLRVLGSSVRTREAISPPDFDGNTRRLPSA